MKRDFLRDLGIEDKDVISKILDENSADIGRAKGETDDLKSQISQLQSQLDKKTSEYDSLKESTKDYNDLSAKVNQLDADKAQLIADKKKLETDLDMKVSQILKNHAIENGVRDANARSVKSVMAHIDVEKITYENGTLSGLTEQLNALKTGEETSFLFGDTQVSPTGTKPHTPPVSGAGTPPTSNSFTDAITKALGKN